MPGAGHPGLGPDFRDLMSRTLRENALQEPDVRGYGPDVRALNPRMNSRNSILGAEIDDFKGKIERFCGWKVGKLGEKLYLLKTQRIHGSK